MLGKLYKSPRTCFVKTMSLVEWMVGGFEGRRYARALSASR